MTYLKDNSVIFDINECPKDIDFIEFDINKNYHNTNFALKIDFKNDFEYSVLCVKKLIKLYNNNISFSSIYNNLQVRYIICNYTEDTIDALKAIYISNTIDKYTYLYDTVFKSLDIIWKKYNFCKFRNNICIATREHQYIQQDDGCCYSFEYTDKIFASSFTTNKQKCKYLNSDKSCKTQNLSCKFFVCKYLKKQCANILNMKNFLLIQAFFSKKQQLILKYNFFHSKEEIINKLLEKNKTPYLIFYLNNQYRISKK